MASKFTIENLVHMLKAAESRPNSLFQATQGLSPAFVLKLLTHEVPFKGLLIHLKSLKRCYFCRLLVQDGVDGNRRLARLPVADNQLPLPTANRNQAVHRLQTRRHGLVHALPGDDARRLQALLSLPKWLIDMYMLLYMCVSSKDIIRSLRDMHYMSVLHLYLPPSVPLGAGSWC